MTATIHDSGYKRLFSNKTIFRQLIQTFVEEEWVPRLDFEHAERLDKSFVSEHYKDTEADIIYKVPENAYGKEWLAQIDNIIATLFLAEAHYDLPLLLEKLLSLYDTEPDRQALQIFINWFRQLAAHGRLKSADFVQIEAQDLSREEVKSMLIKALERERETIRQEGIDIGKKEGIDIGKKEGIEERNRQIAQAMSANGFVPPMIAQLLDLSLPEVEALLSQSETDAGETTDQDEID